MPVQYSSGFVPTSDYYTRDYDINNGLLKVELLNRPGGGVQALITFGRVSHESEVLLSEVGSVTIDVFTDTFTGAGSTTVEKYRYSDGYVLVFVWVDSTNSLPVRRIGKIINITHIYEILDRTYNTIVDLKVIYDTYEFMRGENDVLFNTTKYFVTGEAFYTMRLEEKKLDKYKYSTQEVFSYFGTSQLVINFGASCEFIVVDGGLTVIYIDQFMQRIYVEYLSESGITDYSYDVYPIDQYNIDYTKQILITSNKKAIYLFCNRTIDIDQATTAIVPFVFIFSPDGRILHATNIIATTNIGEYGGPYTFAVGHLETEGVNCFYI
ncbi:MAG: hypothetical protein KatS3mg083_527 [Candidatus Dojkabacteria bacterium]|nr:MAG: hypothetical protein KatS3mg083_527 [Candidatus Dojkabacteria bacterium]